LSRRSHYNPFKAADEKIALSVVYVNNKPQHLVFPLHSYSAVCYYQRLAVESARKLCPACSSGAQLRLTQRNRGSQPTFESAHPRLKASPFIWTQTRCKNAANQVSTVEKWTDGGIPLFPGALGARF
jgi:hypothetical protein